MSDAGTVSSPPSPDYSAEIAALKEAIAKLEATVRTLNAIAGMNRAPDDN